MPLLGRMEEVMPMSKTLLAALVAGAAMAGTAAGAKAAPLPTNVAAMKALAGNDTLQGRWGVGWRGGGWGYRGGWGVRGRPFGWGAGAGALAAGALIGGAYYGSAYGSAYPYYGGYGGGTYANAG